MSASWWHRVGSEIVQEILAHGENQGHGWHDLVERARLPTEDVTIREALAGPNRVLY